MDFLNSLLDTLMDVTPIALLVVFFQLFVLKEPFPNLKNVLIGGVYVVLGLTFFLVGLEKALFPLGEMMAQQLSAPDFIGIERAEEATWKSYFWIYIFAATIGFATSVAEPSLIAVAIKANQVSAGHIGRWGLRLSVASGVAVAMALGTFRIAVGIPAYYFILGGYVIVILQTIVTPKRLVALAYDSGGVTTSTVTVPIIVALGLGLSGAIPGRNPALDGFGLIAMACMFPIITTLGYIQFKHWTSTTTPKSN
ncbi:MAG: DUF1538 domain-containing protein [Cryomorphaceae bacterium]|nr:MAG: DUF1538 domain-containing protein [Cryomorphaceae bacterium]